ncbi:hypothetical protein ACFZA2_17295 [Microbacterium sp. NPDC007973]|uniref:hypothetical protein n=1 Tax=Microbacterium sp. NPDC007973 TaxID=3364182 RepID=UPI0036E214AA
MTTPWGQPLATFDNRDDFYGAYPQLLEGWTVAKHQTRAPFGVDVDFKDDFLVTLCAPEQQAGAYPMSAVTGVATAFDQETGEIHVLAENITHADAVQRFTR